MNTAHLFTHSSTDEHLSYFHFFAIMNNPFFFFLTWPHSLWDFSSPKGNQTLAPRQWKHGVLTTELNCQEIP